MQRGAFSWGPIQLISGRGMIGREIGRTASRASCRPLTSAMGSTRICARESADCFTKLREVSRKFAQIRAVVTRCLASQARHKLGAPSGLFACAKRGRIVTGGTNFLRSKAGKEENRIGKDHGFNHEIREPYRMDTDASLIMRRFGGGGFDAVELGGFDGLGKALLEGGHFDELAGLLEDDLVKLIVLMLQ